MSGEAVMLGYTNGQIYALDARTFRSRLAKFDISSGIVKPANGRFEYSLVQGKHEPWYVAFQLTNGPCGLLDVMTGRVTQLINSPKFSGGRYSSKPRPVFWHGNLCIGYPWSNVLQVCPYLKSGEVTWDEIELEGSPVAMDGNEDIDGLYVGCGDGLVYHVR
jgi:hypothetical protein